MVSKNYSLKTLRGPCNARQEQSHAFHVFVLHGYATQGPARMVDLQAGVTDLWNRSWRLETVAGMKELLSVAKVQSLGVLRQERGPRSSPGGFLEGVPSEARRGGREGRTRTQKKTGETSH